MPFRASMNPFVVWDLTGLGDFKDCSAHVPRLLEKSSTAPLMTIKVGISVVHCPIRNFKIRKPGKRVDLYCKDIHDDNLIAIKG